MTVPKPCGGQRGQIFAGMQVSGRSLVWRSPLPSSPPPPCAADGAVSCWIFIFQAEQGRVQGHIVSAQSETGLPPCQALGGDQGASNPGCGSYLGALPSSACALLGHPSPWLTYLRAASPAASRSPQDLTRHNLVGLWPPTRDPSI